jgi:hypothetical protein
MLLAANHSSVYINADKKEGVTIVIGSIKADTAQLITA